MSIRSGSEKGPISIEATARSVEGDFVESSRRFESTAVRAQPAPQEHQSFQPRLLLGRLAGALTVAAILASALLLLSDAIPTLTALLKFLVLLAPKVWASFGHAPLSAIPLLLAGASFVALQAVLRPPAMELLRRLLLGSAFLLWGIVQLMPPTVLATDLGDLVIALYVFDLGLMVQAELEGD